MPSPERTIIVGRCRRFSGWAALLLLVSPVGVNAFASPSQDARTTRQPARLAPPVIKEKFTQQPCPSKPVTQRTTIEAKRCAGNEILRTDRQINARAKVIFWLRRSTTGKKLFVAAEKAWLAYRSASCESIADVYRGGSAQPILFLTCVVERNTQHLKELASFESLLRHR
jgi:uncharacterized protein YecT (DUF1311 family)